MFGNAFFFASTQLWTPANITTSLWLDAADTSTIIESGGVVTQWSDKSGNNRHLTEPLGTKNPTYVPNKLNGYGCVDFYTAKQLRGSAGNTTLLKFVITVTRNRTATFQGFHSHLGLSSPRIGAIREAGNTGFHYNPYPSAVWEDGSPKVATQGGFLNITLPRIIAFNARIATLLAGIPIMGNYDGGAGGGGAAEEYESIGLSYFPATDERQKLEGYLAHKWGLTANLPIDHPYKSSPPTI